MEVPFDHPFRVDPAFVTPIYVSIVKDIEAIQLELGNRIKDIDFKYNNDWGKTHQISDIEFKSNDIIGCNRFITEIEGHLKNYMAVIGYKFDRYKINESWITKFNTGDYGHIHNHGSHDISGVYYYSTNGKDGDIFFESSSKAMQTSKVFQQPRIKVEPSVGKLIMFPSCLDHGVKTNQTDNTRHSISFNILLDQKGDSDHWSVI